MTAYSKTASSDSAGTVLQRSAVYFIKYSVKASFQSQILFEAYFNQSAIFMFLISILNYRTSFLFKQEEGKKTPGNTLIVCKIELHC